MSTLDDKAKARTSKFRDALKELKSSNGYTFEDLEEICEVSPANLGNFIRANSSIHATTMLKISIATGIQL